MRISEVLHNKPKPTEEMKKLQKKISTSAEKLLDPSLPKHKADILFKDIKKAYGDLKVLAKESLSEAITKIPVSDKDFEALELMMEKPILAVIGPIVVEEIIIDDELNYELDRLSEASPEMDIRPIIAEWFKRVMPDQLKRYDGRPPMNDRWSIIPGDRP